MNPNLFLSLQISILGMGLVFASIILLWALMAVLMRFTAERPLLIEPTTVTTISNKQRAAAVAVTVALALSNQSRPPSRLTSPPTAIVSAWQAVMRANQLKQRGPVRR